MSYTKTFVNTQRPVLEFNARYGRYEWYSRYEHGVLARKAGFYWSPADRCWMTDKAERAVKLIKYADEETRARLLYRFAS